MRHDAEKKEKATDQESRKVEERDEESVDPVTPTVEIKSSISKENEDVKAAIWNELEEKPLENLSTRQNTKVTVVQHERTRSDLDDFRTPSTHRKREKRALRGTRSGSRSRRSEESSIDTGSDMKLFDSSSNGSLELPEKFISTRESKNKGSRRYTFDYPTIIEDAEGEESKKHGGSAAV